MKLLRYSTPWKKGIERDTTECSCGKSKIQCEIILEDTSGYCCVFCEHVIESNVE